MKTPISRDKGKFTEKSPPSRSQRRSGSHEHDPDGSSQAYRDDRGLSPLSLCLGGGLDNQTIHIHFQPKTNALELGAVRNYSRFIKKEPDEA